MRMLVLPDLHQLTALRHLECEFCRPEQIGTARPSLQRLTRLNVKLCKLTWARLRIERLRCLESLSLVDCELQLPPALSACTALTKLVLDQNPGLSYSELSLALRGLE
jgi:hypothetical protein